MTNKLREYYEKFMKNLFPTRTDVLNASYTNSLGYLWSFGEEIEKLIGEENVKACEELAIKVRDSHKKITGVEIRVKSLK